MITRIQRVNIRYFPEPDAKAVTYTAMRKERKPMPNQQRNTINALIRQQCANYDRAGGGDCLFLDCPCPQLQSHSLICRYCRDAVLTADKLLYAEIMGAGGLRPAPPAASPSGRLPIGPNTATGAGSGNGGNRKPQASGKDTIKTWTFRT